MDSNYLLLSLVFSSIGLGYFVYGKKQKKMVPLFCGIALMGYTYVVTDLMLIMLLGVVLLALPYFVRY